MTTHNAQRITHNAILLFIFAFIFTGCATRTYIVEKERVDQQLSGNQGYLGGKAPEALEQKERKTTRQFQAVEVELPVMKLKKSRKKIVKEAPVEETPFISEEAGETAVEAPIPSQPEPQAPAEDFEEYNVQNGDTLQKISKKFYGTTAKWYKIYDLNRSVITNPDRLYVGQSIKIPVRKESK